MRSQSATIAYLHLCVLIADTTAFSTIGRAPVRTSNVQHGTRRLALHAATDLGEQLDTYLKEPSLAPAISFLENNPEIELPRERWLDVFGAIERRTTEAEENIENTRLLESQYQIQSPARNEMTQMYETLKSLNHLRLFGAARQFPPASGSQQVTPLLLEEVTNLSMVALTPKPTNTLLLAGIALAIAEGITSINTGLDLNFLVFSTLALALLDRVTTNGAVFETFVKLFNPGVQKKIVRHEAGHFLAAYLLGLPVEGCVLSSWAALQDARFDKRQVSAGTSFFDPDLSDQINRSVVTRSSIDRYSIVVMAGIAAEAINFGAADGGAGDEMALVSFLSQFNGSSPKSNPPWNNESIRNQARWGALQSVLLIREYKASYDALVDALERGGSLGECIYAIETAGREKGLEPLKRPIGFILDEGPYGIWTTDEPSGYTAPVKVEEKPKVLNEEESLKKLQEYREKMEVRLKDIDEKLKKIDE
jgi:hypothetical protein